MQDHSLQLLRAPELTGCSSRGLAAIDGVLSHRTCAKEDKVNLATVIGSLAACASTISFTPQAWKIIKSRETKDISAGMYVLTVSGFALWTIYGLVTHQWPLIVTNAICLVLSAFILLMKLLPRAEKNRIADAIDPSS
jgi:MtN3 and saliva related transmembrane protein